MSAVNAPHPDEKPADEAAAFFDNDAGEAKAEGLPTLTPDEQRAAAEEYRASRGEPLERAFDEPIPEETEVPEPLKREEELRQIAEREQAEAEANPTPAESNGTTGSTTEPDPTSDSSEAPPSETEPAGDGARSGGALEREYLVFQEVRLTEKTLKHLLAQIEAGNAPEPRLAYFELSRVTSRTVTAALTETYSTHKEALGPKCDMAAVSARSFQVRHVEPKQKVETALSIT